LNPTNEHLWKMRGHIDGISMRIDTSFDVSLATMTSPADTRHLAAIAQDATSSKASCIRTVDVAIVGGGLAGSLAAALLGRAGHRVALIDMHAVYPADFRCEKLVGDQLDLLRGLGLFECLTAIASPIQSMHVARFGRVVDRMQSEEHCFYYQDLVNEVRKRIPPEVDFIVGRVADVSAGLQSQRVTMSNGEIVFARLIVLASGLGDALRQKLGIRRRIIREGHSLSMGFSVAPLAGQAFDFSGFTYYGDCLSERIAYVSFFPVGDIMRANLFCYRGHDGSWARAFRDRPRETLFETLPGLQKLLGDIDVVGKVKIRMTDLYAVENHCREGVVLIGDAFQSTCPAAGNGVTRVLTDVGRLCSVHVPRWLDTPGMGAEKISQFYADPVKQACDARCARIAEYGRSFATSAGVIWHARRLRAYFRPRWRRVLSRLQTRLLGVRRLTTGSRAPTVA
jgi:2-polyprenyl-6-methoxyphenol hydroxylase-like FAD-dependent oxidoreductase